MYFKYPIDIQPPVMSGCHSNKEKWTSELMTHLNWTAPSFYDPVRKPINISSNYPTDSYEFPWGDFVVHYVALKPSNGMRTTCVFSWKIRRELFNTKLFLLLLIICDLFKKKL